LLTDETYATALQVYIAATLVALFILNAWTARRVGAAVRTTVLMVLAAVALAPSHPVEGGSSWAPALFVAGFDFLTDGIDVAMRSLRSLLIAVVIALALSLVLHIVRLALRPGHNDD
jgi:hypothetical protein